MDWGTRHLTVIIGTGAGHLSTKVARRAGHLTNFFPMPGVCPGPVCTGECSLLEFTPIPFWVAKESDLF